MRSNNYQSRRILLPVLLFLFVLSAFTAAAEGFSVRPERVFVNYTDNHFIVEAPSSGELSILISDQDNTYITLRTRVDAGWNIVSWNGCGVNNEKLDNHVYLASCLLQADDMNQYQCEFRLGIEYSAPVLLWALPSSDTVYTEETDRWFVEYKNVMAGHLKIDVYQGEELLQQYSRNLDVKGGKVASLSFRNIWNKTIPPAGNYLVRMYETSNPSYVSEFTLRIVEGKEPEIPLEITGEIIPDRDANDETIWQMMMKPAAVIDLDPEDHQSVYSEPDTSSRVLGTLHGQTQSLNVMEIRDGWVLAGAWNHESGDYIEGWIPRERIITVKPSTEYGLLLDKKAQTLTVFYRGNRLETILVSTGRIEKDKLYQETAAGSFLTGRHRADFSTNGKRYDYVIQYDGGNLLHQIPYDWANDRKDFTEGRAYLGSKASHACVRIQESPGEYGINAYWIWTHIPYRTRLIILDDPDEREAQKALAAGIPEPNEQIRPLEAGETNLFSEKDNVIILSFGGDAVVGARENYYGMKEALPAYLEAKGFSWPFSGLEELFTADDLTSVNLECVFKETKTGEDTTKTWRFRGLPAWVEVLTSGSVELVNLANNHTVDYGNEGYASTMQTLNNSVLYCGNRTNIIVDIKGHKIGFGGCRETAYKNDPDIIARDLRELQDNGAEFIIYQCHWGVEYSETRSLMQEAMARACVRNGADLVIGHHPHIVEGIDCIDGVPVIYSLGNLMFGGTIKLQSYGAFVLQAALSFDHEKPELQLRLVPIMTSGQWAEKINDYRPVIAGPGEAEHILGMIRADTPFILSDTMRIVLP